ncbi:MAG: hypothetical protein CMJ40_00255 [Phycisphaerae bacterium]|nr:hypothetical protein [Phycisphaerae bacterium]
MNRLLRKYSKLLLAVFGTGLMVVFLMPQIPDLVSQFGARSTLVATIGQDDKPISARDWDEVRNELQFLDKVQAQFPPLPLVGQIKTPEQYYLLAHEASEAGMIGGIISAGLGDTELLQLSRNTGFPPATIRQALTNRAGIYRYLSHFVSAGRHSDRRLKGEGRKLFDAADAEVVSLKATPDTTFTPDETAIQSQFETFGDVEPGEGENGFGYRLPDRLRMEWLTIPSESIDESIRNSDAMNERELMKYWRRNEARFPGFEDAEDIPDTVRTAMLNDLREPHVAELTRSINDRLRLPRRGFDESGGYLLLPNDWNDRQTSFDDIRTHLADTYMLEIDAPQTSGDAMINASELNELEGIGRARTDKYSRLPIGMQQLATECKEFNGSGLYPVQAGVAGPILKDSTGNLYVFRITEADGARAPRDLDEVRMQIVEDLQRKANYEAMLEEIEEIERISETDGLKSLADTGWNAGVPSSKSFQKYQPGTVAFYLQQGSVPRPNPAILPGLAQEDPEVIDSILSKASDMDNDVVIADLPESERVMVMPSDKNLAIVAVRLVDRRPLDRDSFQQLAVQQVIPMLLINEEMGGDTTSMRDAFTVDALQARHGFRFAGNDEDSSNANGTADSNDAPTADLTN